MACALLCKAWASGKVAAVVRQREVATWLLLILTLALACAAAGVARAQDEHLGITEYELACMPCHGVDGRGDGPLAKTLKARPSDLTQISKASGGRCALGSCSISGIDFWWAMSLATISGAATTFGRARPADGVKRETDVAC